jgi:type IV secretion system protein VirB11
MQHPVRTQRLADLLRSAMASIIPYLDDPEVLHISISHTGSMWIERFGQGAVDSGITVLESQVEQVIRLVASQCNQVATKEASRLAAVLPSGERFQGFLPPTVRAPACEIRKRPSRIYTLDNYVGAEIMTAEQQRVIQTAIQQRDNIVVAGGTGSGKSTLLNACLDELHTAPGHIVTIEDVPELQIRAPYYLALYTVPGQTTLTNLVSDCLRCNPERIIVGEVRGQEALDVLDAWNTGHPGGLLSLHANRGRALRRLESLIRRAPLQVTLPPEEVRSLIAESVNVIIDIERVIGRPGRRVTAITRCHGLTANGQYNTEIIA